jgi:hypothetical protein
MLYDIFKKEVHIMQNQRKDSIHLNKCKLPLSFIKNNGQEDQRAHFTTNYKGRRFFFSSDRITSVELEPLEEQVPEPGHFPDGFEEPDKPRNGVALELSFTNANSDIIPEGISQQEGYHHYLRGNDSSKWQNGVPHYKELRYNSVWEGVDLEIYGGEDGLKMNWLLDKPEKVSSIRFHWEGADRLEIDEAGNLLIHHALGTLTDLAPIAYQEIDGVYVPVDCNYQLYGGFDFGFELTGDYSSEAPIVIDPIIQYATYLGGSAQQEGYAIAVDNQGHAYITGRTSSSDFPVTPGAFQTTPAGDYDAFVTKFSANGESIIYSTYLGGSAVDQGWSISIDTQNYAYVTGDTNSVDFPITPNAFQTTPGGIFVTKISADGENLVYSTFLGNNGSGIGLDIAVDSQGNAYVAGQTNSTVLPTTPNAFQPTYPGGENSGFITKFSLDGASLIYSTYLGGSSYDNCFGIVLDTQDYAYVTGRTYSSDFPVTPGAFQTTFTPNSIATFVTKLAIDGSFLVYSTFLDGGEESVVNSNFSSKITVDTLGCSSVTGYTGSSTFPITPDAFQTIRGVPEFQTFVTKLSPTGDSLIGSTYLGGGVSLFDSSYGFDIKTDLQGRIYVIGYTTQSNFPTTPNVLPSSLKGTYNAFISILSADLTNLLVSYYLGGSNSEYGYGIAIGPEGAIYTTGTATSTDFPVTTGAYQTNLIGSGDAFVTKTAFAFYKQFSLSIKGLF